MAVFPRSSWCNDVPGGRGTLVAAPRRCGAAGRRCSPCSAPAPAPWWRARRRPSPTRRAGRAALPDRLRRRATASAASAPTSGAHADRRRRRQRQLLPHHRAHAGGAAPAVPAARKQPAYIARPRSTRWSPTSPRSAPARPSPTVDIADAPTSPPAACCSGPTARRATSRPAAGGALSLRADRPPTSSRPPPTQVVEAMRIGPGQMPVFDERTISDDEAPGHRRVRASTSSTRTTGAELPLGGIGPVPEGFVALAGRPRRARRRQRVDRGTVAPPWPQDLSRAMSRSRSGRPAVAFGASPSWPPSASSSSTGAGGQPQARGGAPGRRARRHRRRHRRCGRSASCPTARSRRRGARSRRAPRSVAAFARRTSRTAARSIARRGFLATLAGAALGALGVAALFPIRSLGPRPGPGPQGDAVRARAASGS